MTSKNKYDYTYKSDEFIELEEQMRDVVRNIGYIPANNLVSLEKCKTTVRYLEFLCEFIKTMGLHNDFMSSYYANKYGKRLTSDMMQALENKNNDKMTVFALAKVYAMWREMLRIGARYNLNDMLEYYDLKKSTPVYAPRKKALEAPVFYVNRSLLRSIGIRYPDKRHPQLVVYSVAPSTGKSLIQNFASAQILALDKLIRKTGSILRMSNEEKNVNRFSASVMDLIKTPTFIEIYPEFAKYMNGTKFKMFQKESVEEWKLLDTETEASYYARTMHSAINSIRAKTAIMVDDPSGGLKDSQNKDEHDFITTLFWGDLGDRADYPDDCSMIIGGTQFAGFDIFNDIYDTYEEIDGLVDDDLFTDSYLDIKKTKNGNVVIIKIDCYDGYGNSIFPKVHSNESLEKKANKLEEMQVGLFSLVYRQKRVPLEGMSFDYDLLKTYEKLPFDEDGVSLLSETAIASLDPTRKGTDFCSMPILKKNLANGLYYLIDCVFKKKPITELHQEIAKMLIRHKVKSLVIENNTDTSLASVISMICEANDYKTKIFSGVVIKKDNYDLLITEKYNVTKKTQRINENQGYIVNKFVYPAKGLYSKNTQMGKFMENLTSYSFEKPNKNDDAVDTMAMISSDMLKSKINLVNTVKAKKTLPY